MKDPDTGPDRLPDRGRRRAGAPLLAGGGGADRVLAHPRGRLRRPKADRVSAGRHLDAALAAEAEAYRALLAGDAGRGAAPAARATPISRRTPRPGRASWGRILGALKMAILAGDGAEAIARRAVAETEEADSPASAYVRALALVALAREPDVERDDRGGWGVRADRPCAGRARSVGSGRVRGRAGRDRGRLRGPRPAPLRRRDRRHRARAGAAGGAARNRRPAGEPLVRETPG